ncbi:hypothetical protein [Nocardia cyriacigeorgica]|uniref:hypothetical protein n=1 Tax=Nocardia cyriacigeorgica TaxID=135487 RepID=UPI002455AF3D|nr:hypothetical protein [Nocardia cyriacigeorgica]
MSATPSVGTYAFVIAGTHRFPERLRGFASTPDPAPHALDSIDECGPPAGSAVYNTADPGATVETLRRQAATVWAR